MRSLVLVMFSWYTSSSAVYAGFADLVRPECNDQIIDPDKRQEGLRYDGTQPMRSPM